MGGECKKPLGYSEIKFNLVECTAWGEDNPNVIKVHDGGRSTRAVYEVPAHLVQVNILSVKSGKVEPIVTYSEIEKHFLNGGRPRYEIVDLREQHVTEDLENQLIDPSNATLSAEEQERKRNSLVTFSYEGKLQMSVTFVNQDLDIKNCTGGSLPTPPDFVVNALTTPEFRIDIKFVVIQEAAANNNNKYCDIVGDDYFLSITNGLGGDPNGFKDPLTKKLINYCKNGCKNKIDHDKDDEGNKIGRARVKTKLLAGKPNILSPFIRVSERGFSFLHLNICASTNNIILLSSSIKIVSFTVSNGKGSTASHKSVFFIQGLYSLGPTGSFALPTYVSQFCTLGDTNLMKNGYFTHLLIFYMC